VKSAQRIANEIADWIIERDASEVRGAIASEATLIERYDASRGVVREAIRILEIDGLVEMKRGAAGGLFPREPDGASVTRGMSLFVRSRGITVDELYEARLAIEPRCALLAADRLDGTGVARLREFLERERRAVEEHDFEEFSRTVIEFHSLVAGLSENRFMELVVRSLGELTEHVFSDASDHPPATMTDAHRAHTKIAEAIIAGDPAQAASLSIAHMKASHRYNVAERPRG